MNIFFLLSFPCSWANSALVAPAARSTEIWNVYIYECNAKKSGHRISTIAKLSRQHSFCLFAIRLLSYSQHWHKVILTPTQNKYSLFFPLLLLLQLEFLFARFCFANRRTSDRYRIISFPTIYCTSTAPTAAKWDRKVLYNGIKSIAISLCTFYQHICHMENYPRHSCYRLSCIIQITRDCVN